MKREVIVLSLGGSLIYPKKIDKNFIKKFKKIILKNANNYKFIAVCGGGALARERISRLQEKKATRKEQSLAGIKSTRENAKLLMKAFGKNSNKKLPDSIKQVRSQLEKNKIIFLGALGYHPRETSDTTASKLAKILKSKFINLTNVNGLYTSDPRKNSKAKLISEITWKNFEKRALKIKYKPGQHFVLDQEASTIIRKNKIPTYILGPDLRNLDKFLNSKPFIGTRIEK